MGWTLLIFEKSVSVVHSRIHPKTRIPHFFLLLLCDTQRTPQGSLLQWEISTRLERSKSGPRAEALLGNVSAFSTFVSEMERGDDDPIQAPRALNLKCSIIS